MASFILMFGPMLIFVGALGVVLVIFTLTLWALGFLGLTGDGIVEGLAILFSVLLLPAYFYFVIRIWLPAIWMGLVNFNEAIFRNNGMSVIQAIRAVRDRLGCFAKDWTRYRKFIRGRN